jgi:hypothetical protein
MTRNNINNAPHEVSLTHINTAIYSAANTTPPEQEETGTDVREWLAILVTANAHDPLVGSAATDALLATVKLRMWRWRARAPEGAGRPTGQWFADTSFTLSLNGDTDTNPMERAWVTHNAEKVYFEIEEITDPSGNLVDFAVGIYGMGPKRGEDMDGVAGASLSAALASATSGGLTSLVYATDPTDSTTAVLALVDSEHKVVTSHTGAHDVATANPLSRGGAVATDYDKTDVAHDDDVHIVATLDGKQIQAGYNRPGDYNRQAEIDPLNMQYVNDKVADVTNSAAATSNYYLDLNGFKRMSAQLEITSGSGTVTVKFFGTVEDDDPDLTARTYQDVTLKAYSAGSFSISNILPDTAEFWGCFTAVKINVVIVNASADSSYRIDTKRHY